MAAYYNENDPFAAAWLRELIQAGLIADGEVDERSIEDVEANDLTRFRQCHFFAGIGGWSRALRISGWPDDKPVWTGSCPCQPFSSTGKRLGFADERHLWPIFYRLIAESKPPVVFGEQVGGEGVLPWIDLILDDLEAAAYTVWTIDFPACSVGAPENGRLTWTWHSPPPGHWSIFAADSEHGNRRTDGFWRDADWLKHTDGKWRPVEPGTFPLADGLPGRVAILRGIGNAIVPQQAAAFIETVMEVI